MLASSGQVVDIKMSYLSWEFAFISAYTEILRTFIKFIIITRYMYISSYLFGLFLVN